MNLHRSLAVSALALALAACAAPATRDIAQAPADAFLAAHDYLDWTSLTETEQYDVLYWHDQFDLFNNGQLGVPHCE